MKLSQIRANLDFFNAVPIQQIGPYELEIMRAAALAWRAYDNKPLGDMRNVIDDRIKLAQSRINTAARYQRAVA